MKTVALTLYDRTPEVIKALNAGLSLPGNIPDKVAVCYDRAPSITSELMRKEFGDRLVESFLSDDYIGPRCPSLSWNNCLELVNDMDHVFCMSSDVVLAPHTVSMAYHMAKVCPDMMILGKTEHCGQSYAWTGAFETLSRTINCSIAPRGLGFFWLIPMKQFKKIGGFDEAFMKGFCYEDDDFTLRMWEVGCDFLFVDDMIGFHLEHKRDHLKNGDGRVTVNEKVFLEKHGDLDKLREWRFEKHFIHMNVGMSVISHEPLSNTRLLEIFKQQKLYGQNESWRAIPVEFTNGSISN